LVGNATSEDFNGVITLLNQTNTSFCGRVTWEAYYINKLSHRPARSSLAAARKRRRRTPIPCASCLVRATSPRATTPFTDCRERTSCAELSSLLRASRTSR
jgi:hypothetical protein